MFDDYRDKYENVTMKRENGILEVALHTRGGPLVFNGHVHEALARAFRDIGDDAENHVVILTGAGNEFCAQITADGFDFFTPTGLRQDPARGNEGPRKHPRYPGADDRRDQWS